MKPQFKKGQALNNGIQVLKVYPIGHEYATTTSVFYLIDSPDFGNDVVSEGQLKELIAKAFNVMSPDGIPITLEPFKTIELAFNGFKEWVNGFVKQGYYSSNAGQIDLRDLEDLCYIQPII